MSKDHVDLSDNASVTSMISTPHPVVKETDRPVLLRLIGGECLITRSVKYVRGGSILSPAIAATLANPRAVRLAPGANPGQMNITFVPFGYPLMGERSLREATIQVAHVVQQEEAGAEMADLYMRATSGITLPGPGAAVNPNGLPGLKPIK